MTDHRCAELQSDFKFDLPLELQYQIFAFAARSDDSKNTLLPLCLVSRYVYNWIKPIIYEKIILNSSTSAEVLLPLLKSLDPQFIAKAVKLIGVLHRSDIIVQVLQLCTNADALVLTVFVEYDDFKDYRPRRLAFFDTNFDEYNFPTLTSPFNLPLFSRVTHLELYELMLDLPYEIIPYLTHLMLFAEDWEPENPAKIKKIVEKCVGIKLFLILFGEEFGETAEIIKQVKGVIESPRLILSDFTEATDFDYGDPDVAGRLCDGTSIWGKMCGQYLRLE